MSLLRLADEERQLAEKKGPPQRIPSGSLAGRVGWAGGWAGSIGGRACGARWREPQRSRARRRSARGTPGEGPRPTRARGVDFAAPIAEASLADDREACGGGGPGGPDRLSQLRDNKNDNDNNDNDNDDNSFILIMMMIIYHSNDNDDNDDSVRSQLRERRTAPGSADWLGPCRQQGSSAWRAAQDIVAYDILMGNAICRLRCGRFPRRNPGLVGLDRRLGFVREG